MSIAITNDIDLLNNRILNAGWLLSPTDPVGPNLPNGHIYYNNSDHDLRAKINGTYQSLLTKPGSIDHDALLNFVANEHVDHSAVTLTINGTANQIIVGGAGGDLTAGRTWNLSLPQSIHTAATPTFGGITLTRAGIPLSATNTTNSSSSKVADFSVSRTGAAVAADEGYVSFNVKTSTAVLGEFGRLTFRAEDVVNNSKDGKLVFGVAVDNVLTDRLELTGTGVNALGTLTQAGVAVVTSTRTVSTNGGSGLSGGGDLSANRSLSVNINGLSEDGSPETTDYVMTWDGSEGALRKVRLENLPGGSGGHSQNTDTGTTSSTFVIDSDGTYSATLRANTVALTNNRVYDFPDVGGTLITSGSSVTDLVGITDVGSGAVITTPERNSLHSQNTDTGTTSQSFVLASGASGDRVAIKASNNELHIRNFADSDFADLRVNNLYVEGTTTTVDSETVAIADNIILLNSNVTGTPSENGGIEIERGTSPNSAMLWNESTDRWTTSDGTNTHNVARVVSQAVGNGSDTQISVTHNLGTRSVQVSVYKTGSPYNHVIPDVESLSTTAVRLNFATAPTSGEYTVVIVG